MAGVPCVLLDVKYDSGVDHAPSRARCGRHAVVETTAERYACSIHAHLALEEDELAAPLLPSTLMGAVCCAGGADSCEFSVLTLILKLRYPRSAF